MVLIMKKVILLFLLAAAISCTSNTVSTDSAPKASPTGWSDEDTYTVRVTDKTEDDAVNAAKHKILKDIVDVRVRNNSRYTDIVKIRDEFDMPLKNGKIIERMKTGEGLMIYYQIHDKGLKKKFQRQ
jgi:maltose-binding protein MalE